MSTLDSLYRTSRWRQIRKLQLGREPLCCMCQQAGRVRAATVADHVAPHRGNVTQFWAGELQSLCQSCHSGDKQTLERGGRLKGCNVDGTPRDPNNHWNKAKR